nr:GTPase Era, mitochondrial [Osmia lignaria]
MKDPTVIIMVLFIIKNCLCRVESHFLKRSLFCTTVWNANTGETDYPLKHDDSLISQSSKKCVKVAFIGLPNVGKSTLINQLTRRSICPASAKVHTTMHKAEVVYTEDDTQIIFMDTPGLVTRNEIKKYKLVETFTEDPIVSIKEADVIGIIQDVTNVYTRHKINNFVKDYLENKREDTPLILVFNKIDRINKKSVLLELTKLLTNPENSPKFDDIFMISALTGDGIDDLRNYLLDSAKVQEWKYEKDCNTDQTVENIIQETVRAKLMDVLPAEMPFNIKLQMEHFDYTEDDGIQCTLALNCPKPNYMKTLLTHKGEKIKHIAFHVEKELRNAFRKPVIVRLSVQCDKKKRTTIN